MRWTRRLLPWLSLPAVVGGVLAWGHRSHPEWGTIPWNPPPLPVTRAGTAPVPTDLELLFRDPEGKPLEDVQVVLIEPSLASGRSDASGRVRLPVYGGGLRRLMAWHDDCALLTPDPFSTPPTEGFRFAPLPHPHLRNPEPVQEIDRSLRFRDLGDHSPLPGLLVLAWPATAGAAPPFVGVTDAEGRAILSGTPPGPMLMKVYAPGLPPEPPWLLASGALRDLDLQVVRPTFTGLTPGAFVRPRRTDLPAELPAELVPPSGTLHLGPLPPGEYLTPYAG